MQRFEFNIRWMSLYLYNFLYSKSEYRTKTRILPIKEQLKNKASILLTDYSENNGNLMQPR